jgi:hypothetical protein
LVEVKTEKTPDNNTLVKLDLVLRNSGAKRFYYTIKDEEPYPQKLEVNMVKTLAS